MDKEGKDDKRWLGAVILAFSMVSVMMFGSVFLLMKYKEYVKSIIAPE